LLVVIFTFFYSAIVVNTRDIADNLKKSGSFIPGIRPGQPTVDYINKILASASRPPRRSTSGCLPSCRRCSATSA
jgi:preprotein translocase subunit SecY